MWYSLGVYNPLILTFDPNPLILTFEFPYLSRLRDLPPLLRDGDDGDEEEPRLMAVFCPPSWASNSVEIRCQGCVDSGALASHKANLKKNAI